MRPRFSIILAVTAAAGHGFEASVRATRNQLYADCEVLIAGDEAGAPAWRALADTHVGADSRMRIITAGSVVDAVNGALAVASGDLIAIMEPQGELAPHALYLMAVAFNADPTLAMLYGDEDCIDPEGRRHSPSFKPAWNADLLVSEPFIGPFVAYRADLLKGLGGWRASYAGVEQWDLALRASATTAAGNIHRLPQVLYHRRLASGEPRAVPPPLAARCMLGDHFARCRVAADVASTDTGAWRTKYVHSAPLVSVVIPTRNGGQLLRGCVESVLRRTDYKQIELLVVDNRSDAPATLDYLAELRAEARVRVLRFDMPFNFSAINNWAARQAGGAVLALLNDDVEAITPDWLDEMVGHALRPEVGAVGAQLHYRDGRIQHAGVVLGLGGLAGHAYRGSASTRGCGMDRTFSQEVSAVTAACLVLRADVYRAVGGLDESLAVAFNDIDLCLRLRQRGYRIVWTPYARLYHLESITRGLDRTAAKARRFRREEALMRQRWGALLHDDPAYNPNLSLIDPSFALSFPPRVTKPWRQIRNHG